MQFQSPTKNLSIASFLSLAASLALGILVIERYIAAGWQWYKFAGYSGNGHINLSLNSGLVLSGILVVLFGFALSLNHFARRQSVARAASWSRWTMRIAVVVAVSYWLLALSGLNVWRT